MGPPMVSRLEEEERREEEAAYRAARLNMPKLLDDDVDGLMKLLEPENG